MKVPEISVIMPVCNSENFIQLAVKSILNQSFDNFEFIIIDDYSTDKSRIILEEIEDQRIIRINNNKQTGNYKCRNQGLRIAQGKYICVMDSDDLSHPDRLLKQYNFMESHPEYMAVGTDIEFFKENSFTILFQRHRDPWEIKTALLKNNVCTHPTLMIRNEIFNKHQIYYNEEYYYSGDYDLLVNISRIGSISNIGEPLLRYRIHDKQISSSKNKEQIMYANQIRLKQLSFFDFNPSIEEILLHLSLMNELTIPKEQWKAAQNWCNKLLRQNNKKNIYPPSYLHSFLKNCLTICFRKAIKYYTN